MLPILLGLGAIYGTGKLLENARYWNDYRRNTGKSPRYPFRVGALGSYSNFGFLKRF